MSSQIPIPLSMYVNVTTVDGELLLRFPVGVSNDRMYPLGNSMLRADTISQIEDAARIVQARREEMERET